MSIMYVLHQARHIKDVYTCHTPPSAGHNRHLECQIVQDEALYICRLLFFEDPALKAQQWCGVPKGYLSLGAFWEVCQSQPPTGKHVGKAAQGACGTCVAQILRCTASEASLSGGHIAHRQPKKC